MRVALAALTLVLAGCGAAAPQPDAGAMRERADFTICGERRPEFCTQEYVPVCALRSTGVECVTTPCDGALERVTKPNRCGACADAEVIGWIAGACDADPVDSPLYLDP